MYKFSTFVDHDIRFFFFFFFFRFINMLDAGTITMTSIKNFEFHRITIFFPSSSSDWCTRERTAVTSTEFNKAESNTSQL